MAIVLDHTIVPAHDKVASARFFARVFGLEYKGPHSHFAPVQVNEAFEGGVAHRRGDHIGSALLRQRRRSRQQKHTEHHEPAPLRY